MKGNGRASGAGDYEVGHCKPPVEHRFKKGNPGGPGGDTRSKDRFNQVFDKLAEQVEKGLAEGQTLEDALIEVGVKKSLKGDFRFWQALLDRRYGKVPDRLAGHDGGPIQVSAAEEERIRGIVAEEHPRLMAPDPSTNGQTAPGN